MPQGSKGGEMQIDMPVEDGDNLSKYFDLPPAQVWTSVEISQTLDPGSTDGYTNRINIGDSVRFSRANPRPVEFDDVKVMSAPCCFRQPADALIRHLRVQLQGVELDGK